MNEKYLDKNTLDITKFINNINDDMCILVSSLNKIITGNNKILHTDKYLSFNVKTNNEIPVVLLMGGNSYYIYYKLFSKYLKLKNYEEIIIGSIDYDISIIVNDNFTQINAIDIFNKFVYDNEWFFSKKNIFENITKEDIKKDIFLKTKKILNKDHKIFLFTFTKNIKYLGFQISIKYNNILYQILEIIFWFNYTISDNLNIIHFNSYNNILYDFENLNILLPHPYLLVNSNIVSIENRYNTTSFEKCSKDFFRILFFHDIINSEIIINNINIEIIKILLKFLFEKINNKIFKLPFTICNLNITFDNKKTIYNLYKKFMDSNIEIQLNVLLNLLDINENEKNVVLCL